MTIPSSTLENAAGLLADAFRPLLPILANRDASAGPFKQLVANLGWTLPDPVPPSLLALKPTIETLAEATAALDQIRAKSEAGIAVSDEEALIVFGIVAVALTAVIVQLSELKPKLTAELPAAYRNATHIEDKFVTRLVDALLILAVYRRFPTLGRALRLVGLFELKAVDEDATIFQPDFTLRRIHWERVTKLFQDPGAVMAEVYGWGKPNLDLAPLLDALQSLSIALDAHGVYDFPSEGLLRALAPGVDPKTADVKQSYEFPLIDVGIVRVALAITAIPKAAPAELQGLAIAIVASGGAVEFEIPLSETVSLLVGASLDASAGLALSLRPDAAPGLVTDVDGSRVPVDGAGLSVGLQRSALSGAVRFPVFTLPGGSGLYIGEGSVKVGIEGRTGEDIDVFVEGSIRQGRVTIQFGEGDGFLAQLLPPEGFHVDFDLTGGVSRLDGFYFEGSASLEIQIPIHLNIGPIAIEQLYLIATFGGADIPIELSSAISAKLGPLAASVDRLGLKANLSFPGEGGNLGPVNLGFGFKPPNGVGLAIDAGVVKGGGYLYLDFEKGEYAGALELVISDWLALKAIGLITTKNPDGTPGFSLLLIITAEFSPGIQLGYGFVLTGVGGLLGLNRTMRLQPLVEGVRTGAVQSVMFPRDVIANAPRIISDLKTFFPPHQGIFLIGPMAKLGWGTPTLISLSLGVIIEIPGNIAILGVLTLILPDPDAPVLSLQVNFVGAIEFNKKRAYFFAALYDSRLLFMTLEGEMGLLIAWGEDANFVVSVGGFHPQFNPPPLPFPTPKRLAITILNESWGRIQASTYFAVTSNSVQLGVRADLYFGYSEFKIEGYLGFDALFKFNPFYFIIEISAGASLKVFGIGLWGIKLRFTLEGPTPWHAKGYGEVSFLFFSFKARFDETWGESRDTTLPPIAVMPLLTAEYNKLENWTAEVPAANRLRVSLRKLEGGPTELVMHPLGQLRVTQRAVPLNLTIDKVGTQKPSDANRFALSATAGLNAAGDASEQFAIGQFQNVKDPISLPAFQPEDGGLMLSAANGGFRTGEVTERTVRHETIIIDTNYRRYHAAVSQLTSRLFDLFLGGNAVARSSISNRTRKQLQPFDNAITVGNDRWAVASARDNCAVNGNAVFNSEAQAREFLNSQVALDASSEASMHVIPESELAGAP